MNAQDVELAVADHFGVRQNVIVPNVSWGIGLSYEADLVVLRPSGFAVEIEVKVSRSDIKADLKKRHGHGSKMFRECWFAVPEEMADDPNIPQRFGVLAIGKRFHYSRFAVLDVCRRSFTNRNAVRWTDRQRRKLLELGVMRVWTLKKHLQSIRGLSNADVRK